MGKLLLLFAIIAVLAATDSLAANVRPTLYPPEMLPDGKVKCSILENPIADRDNPPCVSTCRDPNPRYCPFYFAYFEYHCVCKEGYVRPTHNNRICIRKEECPKQASPEK